MDKRNFLKTSGALLTGSMLSRLIADQPPTRTNWSGNYQFKAQRLRDPKTVEELRQFISSGAKVKALGARHSFNNLADTADDQISLKHLDSMVLDRKAHTVTVGAGLTYGQVAPYLYSNGYALHNLASLPHVSVAGACATATHGSGVKNGNLSTAVSGLEIVTADGNLVTLSREQDGDKFLGAVVGLGGLGVITKVTLNLLPTFDVRQVVYQNLSMNQLEHNLEEIFCSGYSVSLFTDWQNHKINQLWIKSRVEPGKPYQFAREYFGATLATRNLHPLEGHSAENCTEQMGIPGPWHERLPHFKMNFTPSSGQELQTEYFVPAERGFEAILAVEQLKDKITPHLFVTELRRIAPDDLWMSTAYKRDSMAIHFTWKPEWPAVKNILPLIEEKLAPFQPRPHWAKLFTMPPSRIQASYKRLPDFKNFMKQHDPQAKFRNDFLNLNLYSV
jgi:xylitol oxidase